MENRRPQSQHQPQPLRIAKTPTLSKLGVGPISRYPHIPRRRSSLCAVSRTCSGQSAISTRTPSLGNDVGELQILKTRVNANVSDEAFRRDLDDVDELDVSHSRLCFEGIGSDR